MRLLKFDIKKLAKELGCEPKLLYSDVIISDNEISNDLSPSWIYTNAKIICSGFIYKDEITILLAEEDDEISFKNELIKILNEFQKENSLYAFNRHMESGNFKGFLNINIPIEEIKPFFSKGFSKDRFYSILTEKKIIPLLNLKDKFNGDGGRCIPTWEKYKQTGDIQHILDIAQHNINCLIKECLILKHDSYFKENYLIDKKGWMLREYTEQEKADLKSEKEDINEMIMK